MPLPGPAPVDACGVRGGRRAAGFSTLSRHLAFALPLLAGCANAYERPARLDPSIKANRIVVPCRDLRIFLLAEVELQHSGHTERAEFIVDTGSPSTSVSVDLLWKLFGPDIHISDPPPIERLRLGKAEFLDVAVVPDMLEYIPKETLEALKSKGIEIGGILGLNVLSAMGSVTLDWGNAELSLERGSRTLLTEEIVLPMERDGDGHWLVPVGLGLLPAYPGADPVDISPRLVIDTGATYTSVQVGLVFDEVRLGPGLMTDTTRDSVGGRERASVRLTGGLRLGKHSVPDTAITATWSWREIDGLLGENVLSRFVVTMDFVREELRLLPTDREDPVVKLVRESK